MARQKSKTLTEGELRIMQVIWALEGATVKEVASELESKSRGRGIAYNTVQTMMGILVDKGYLARRKVGRAFTYSPLVSRREARSEAVRYLVGQFFGGSQLQLMHNLLEDEPVDADQLTRLRAMLDRERGELPAEPPEPSHEESPEESGVPAGRRHSRRAGSRGARTKRSK